MVLLKTTKPITLGREIIQTQQMVTIYPEHFPSSLHHVVPLHVTLEGKREPSFAAILKAMQEIEELLCQFLWSHLQSLGLFREKQIPLTSLSEQVGISTSYDRWLQKSIALLEQKNYLHLSDAPASDGQITYTVSPPTLVESTSLWQQWEQHKERWMQNADLKAQVALVETTLHTLPALLTGKQPAVETLFPKGSMQLVEGIYQQHTIADYFNDILATLVAGYLQERLTGEEHARIRILEIGAGTGGTTSRVLQMMQPYREAIAEYCCSDISGACLCHALSDYAGEEPLLA